MQGETVRGFGCSQNQNPRICSRDGFERRFVWTVKDGVVGRKYVTVDGYQEQGVIVSAGLEPGDKVVVKGAAKVSTGMKVNSVEQAF